MDAASPSIFAAAAAAAAASSGRSSVLGSSQISLSPSRKLGATIREIMENFIFFGDFCLCYQGRARLSIRPTPTLARVLVYNINL